jgi:hypothetical protein
MSETRSMKVHSRTTAESCVVQLIRRCSLWLLIDGAARFVLIVALMSGLCGTQAKAQSDNEYQIKGAFLYNFAKFVEWPAAAFNDDNAAFIFGIVGEDPFGSALDQTINGKTINGRQLVITRLKWGQNLRGCQILFVSSSERSHLAQILGSLSGASVLTVGEMAQFSQQGGIIRFMMEENKLRFEINTEAAAGAGLKVSSKLLTLAKTVRGRR